MNILDFTLEGLKAFFIKNSKKAFHAKQIFEWIYQKKIKNFDDMSNLSKELREFLKKELNFNILKISSLQESKDLETIKYLFKLEDGLLIESVLIKSDERRTLCLSSQVGCQVRCAFCASGKKGLLRNLSTAEIIEQILHVEEITKENITHIVFMGMGEPLDNFDNVIKAINIINDPSALNISQRRITISTVGVLDKIILLKESNLKINLALSLHAPNQQLREKLIPYAKRYLIEDILKALDDYFNKTKRDITFEYILIEDVNDRPEHAKELSKLLNKRHSSVNLIPYNPIDSINYKRSSNKKIKDFKNILISQNVIVTQRYQKGSDIAAACGQLALKS